MLKRILTLCILIATLLVLSGCNDKIEVEDLGIVRMTGIDWDSANNKYLVTVNVQRPQAGGAVSGKGGGNKGGETPWVASAEGDSVMDAFKNLRARAASTLSWQHSTILVIGEDMAAQGVDKIMDFFSRNREIRYTTNMFLSKGKANDLMKVTPETQSNLPDEIDGIIKNSKIEWNKSYVPDLREFLITLSYKDYASIVGSIEAVAPAPFSFQEVEEVSGIKPSNDVVAVSGAAIIKNYKLSGWLDTTETRGYRWIEGKIDKAVVNVFSGNSTIAIEISNAKSDINVDVKDNKVLINIKTKATGRVVEAVGNDNFISEDGISKLESLTSQAIKSEMLKSIEKTRMLHSDIFGFGRKISEKNPDEWSDISKNWDDYYEAAEVKIEVTTSIKSIGMTSKSITKVNR